MQSTFAKTCDTKWVVLRSSVIQVWYCDRSHLCNKTVCNISSLLDIPQSTINIITRRWKHVVTSATQTQSNRLRKITERDQQLQWLMVCKSHQCSADSTAEEFRTSTGINVRTKTVQLELIEMSFYGRAVACKPYITRPMSSIRWRGVSQ